MNIFMCFSYSLVSISTSNVERRGGWGGDVKERERWEGEERRVGRRCEGEGEVKRRGKEGGVEM